MSFMNALSAFAGSGGENQPSTEQHASIAQAFLQHFSGQPGGMSGVVDQFHQQGMGGHMDSWLSTQPGAQPNQTMEPGQVEQALGQQQVQSIAQRAGVNSEMAKVALAAALPMLMSHLSQGSGQLPQQAGSGSGLAGMAEGLFSRAL